MVTSGKEWRKPREQGVEITLPSGNVARIRPLSPYAFLRYGNIPDTLSAVVSDMVNGRGVNTETEETMHKFLEILDLICIHTMVSPRIVANPQADDEIAIEDLDEADKMHIYRQFGRTASQLESFRPEPESDVESVSVVPTDEYAAVETLESAPA